MMMNKCISILLVAVLIVSMFPVYAAAAGRAERLDMGDIEVGWGDVEIEDDEENPPIKPDGPAAPGDLDKDGRVNENDVIYLLQHLLMPGEFSVDQPVDYDRNETVDEGDVIYLLQHLLMPEDFPLQ